MLRFAVFDAEGDARWSLDNAYLVGPDEQATTAVIGEEGGVITCESRVSHATALCLLCEAGPAGRLMLPTCLLPDRDEPYVLSVELARHRIKAFIARSEEWQMFDLSAEHPAMVCWEQARQLFTRAITTADAREADRFAWDSLVRGIEATERLAMAHAEILLHRRFGNRAASSSTLGVRVWPGRDGKGLRDLIVKEFDVLVLPLCWRELEVEEGRYNWEALDRWMEWASNQNKPVVAGPLLDFSRRNLPKWMYVWQHDYDTCRDLAYDFVERVLKRYASTVGFWNVASGLNINDNFSFSHNQMIDLTRMVALHVRQARKGARVMVELREPFGEHTARYRDSLAPLAYIDRLVQEGVRLDAIGVQMMVGGIAPAQATRDLIQLSGLLDRFFLLDTPIIISALGAPSEMREAAAGSGYWEKPWSTETQQRWLSRVFCMLLSKPFVESVFWSDLFDSPGSLLPTAGLINAEGKPRPALKRLVALRKRLNKPLGPLQLPARVYAGADDETG